MLGGLGAPSGEKAAATFKTEIQENGGVGQSSNECLITSVGPHRWALFLHRPGVPKPRQIAFYTSYSFKVPQISDVWFLMTITEPSEEGGL